MLQMTFFNINETNKVEKAKKRNWENAFQAWSNREQQNESTHYGKCGYSSICDYCSDVAKGRPCVRALNRMCREKHIDINYDFRNFQDVWNL